MDLTISLGNGDAQIDETLIDIKNLMTDGDCNAYIVESEVRTLTLVL